MNNIAQENQQGHWKRQGNEKDKWNKAGNRRRGRTSHYNLNQANMEIDTS